MYAIVERAPRAGGTVFDDDVMQAERLPLRIAGAEDRDARDPHHRGQMRRTRIVADERRTFR